MAHKSNKLSMDEFSKIQKEILQSWPTGKGVDFQKGVDYHKSLPEHRVFAKKLEKAKNDGVTLIQPRAGVAMLEKHIELLQFLEKEGEADLLPSTIDSYTRHNRYQEAENAIQEEKEKHTERSLLNGFPAVNWGVDACRKVVSSVNIPVQVRHGTPDARLLTEITYCGGFTSYEGGGISYNIPYAKSHTLESTITDWMYVDRLTGLYEEAGVTINREPYGPLTGTLVPPCISNSVAVFETLLAAEQGCKSITVGYGQCGNLHQDIAAVRSLVKLTEEYLHRYGYNDVVVTSVFHQWMGGFPQDEAKAFGVISWGAATAALCGATKVIVKTPHEAMGIPTMQANAAGLRATKQVVSMLDCEVMANTAEIQTEIEMIDAETRCILDACLELGQDDFYKSVIAGFAAGLMDVPFAPSKFNMGLALPARDNHGCIRFLDFGNLPFTQDIKNFHKSRMEARAKFEGRPVSFQMVIDDVYAISRGKLIGRPTK
ncbi:MAG: methylaspartate mutase subunit E [Oscillospiraceae bacterium]